LGRTETARLAPQHRRSAPATGVEGNEKLTAMTGVLLWFAVMTVHVLNYAPRLPRMLMSRSAAGAGCRDAAPAGYSLDQRVPGRATRWLVLAASLAAGVGVAAVTMHISSYWGFSF
jgi:hypothetical protein